MIPENELRLVAAESARLFQYLEALPAEGWTRQSACERWQVRDVVAHLAGGAEMYTTWVGRGLQGDPSPTEGFSAPGSGDSADMGEAIAQRSIKLREQLGEDVLSPFGARDAELNRLLSGISGEDWEKPCYHPAKIFPARDFLGLRLFELALHAWDIRWAAEPRPRLHPQSQPQLVRFSGGAAERLMKVDPAPSSPARFRFAMTTTPWIGIDLVVDDKRIRTETEPSLSADVTFGCTSEDFILLMAGRLSYEDGVASGRLTAQGDATLAENFGGWLQGLLPPPR